MISCAIRRATSDQAARRWSSNCCVMSSNVRTCPRSSLTILTAKVRSSVPEVSCMIVSRSRRSSAASSSGANDKRATPTGFAPSVASNVCADAFIRRTVRSASTEITPAETPVSTASISARRLSSALVCSSSRRVIVLNAIANVPTSSRLPGEATRADRSPAATRRDAPTRSPTGRTRRSATFSAIQTATPTISSEIRNNAALNCSCNRRERSSKLS